MLFQGLYLFLSVQTTWGTGFEFGYIRLRKELDCSESGSRGLFLSVLFAFFLCQWLTCPVVNSDSHRRKICCPKFPMRMASWNQNNNFLTKRRLDSDSSVHKSSLYIKLLDISYTSSMPPKALEDVQYATFASLLFPTSLSAENTWGLMRPKNLLQARL